MAETETTIVKTSEAAKSKKAKASVKEDAAYVTKKAVAKRVDENQYVTVRNGFHGMLVYISPRTGEKFVWNEFGSEQDMELRELKSAKNSSKAYFTRNYFMFDDEWVIDYLGMRQYYQNVISIEHFDDFFKLSPEEMQEKLNKISDGQKRSIGYRARQLIAEGEIDSLKTIATLEKVLGIELTEK